LSSKTAKLTVRTERFSSDKRFVLAYVMTENLSARSKREDYHWIEVETGRESMKFTTERAASFWLEGYELALEVANED